MRDISSTQPYDISMESTASSSISVRFCTTAYLDILRPLYGKHITSNFVVIKHRAEWMSSRTPDAHASVGKFRIRPRSCYVQLR